MNLRTRWEKKKSKKKKNKTLHKQTKKLLVNK